MNLKTLISTAAIATVLMASNALAEHVAGGAAADHINVSDVWARASAGMAKAGGVFMTLHNPTTHDDTLVSAASDVADTVQLHTHTMVDGVMQMREVEGGIKVPAGETVMMQPGGYHVMLMGLKAPLAEGATFPLTLTFDGGQVTTVDVKVVSPSAMNMGNMDHGNMDHGQMHEQHMNGQMHQAQTGQEGHGQPAKQMPHSH